MSSLIQNLQCDEFPDVVPEFSVIEFIVSGRVRRVYHVHKSRIATTPDGEFYRYRGMWHALISRKEMT